MPFATKSDEELMLDDLTIAMGLIEEAESALTADPERALDQMKGALLACTRIAWRAQSQKWNRLQKKFASPTSL
jgi:hypothetical protein